MKTILFILSILVFFSCNSKLDKKVIKEEIYQTEKAFEKMAADSGAAKAFYFFADDSAVINRSNDTLIIGKEKIKAYYLARENKNAKVNWTPDFIEVSDCGTLGYTYGKYVWKIPGDSGKIEEFKGFFHTVWKKQQDNSWKYVWD
jgi:ketosteroid isomerase-like protein